MMRRQQHLGAQGIGVTGEHLDLIDRFDIRRQQHALPGTGDAQHAGKMIACHLAGIGRARRMQKCELDAIPLPAFPGETGCTTELGHRRTDVRHRHRRI